MDIHIHFNVEFHFPSNEQTQLHQPVRMLNETLQDSINGLVKSRSLSTINNYATAVRSFQRFLGSNIPLVEIDSQLMCSYANWLRNQNVCLNTISCYMRSLRSLLLSCDSRMRQAFEHVYTGKARTEKRGIPLALISRLQKLELPPKTFLHLARDVFMFSFYAMGMPFVDVAFLRQTQVKEGKITYQRRKTGQRIVLTIEPEMLDIIRRHQHPSSVYVFPLLHQGDNKEYQRVLCRYNRSLRRIGQMVGLKTNLTSYVVRHSWASTAYHANVDLPVISKALGHTNPQTTLTYIREIDDQRLCQANRRIIDEIIRKNY